MTNNEEKYCNHCKRETTFFLESDFIWYCGECEKPYGSVPIMDMETPEFQEAKEEFEEENGDSVYCTMCGNFITINEALKNEVCPICGEDIDPTQLEDKGYSYDENSEKWIENEDEE